MNTSHTAKYVDYLWAIKFLSSNNNIQQEQFLQWVAVCMFQQLRHREHNPIIIPNIEIDDSDSIDVYSSFGLAGSKTCKKNVWSLTDSTYRNSKVKAFMNTIQQMFLVTGACLLEVLGLYFQTYQAKFLTVLNYVGFQSGTESELVMTCYVIIRQTYFSNIANVRNTKEEILLLKDFMLLSDERYQHFIDYVGLNHFLPCSTTICRCRKEINNIITKNYEIINDGTCIACNYLNVLHDLLIIHANECKRINADPKLKMLAKTFLVGAVGPLNLILSPQSRHSYISCMTMDNNENKEKFQTTF
ncbi:hypothetical protein FDP41_013051 [Naegleria fowleri]|uniref:Uncharacterized protein n=1 Tax=Naegleria fowleri TaxID=5763 RepID=A0A6A5BT53_NAEFO|nr:uncharacterized protein FDP41_013051 [Naegleria fowleri]KAF0981263.1 hypothetical protein FDP41_013051 [Naegleria fowleri]